MVLTKKPDVAVGLGMQIGDTPFDSATLGAFKKILREDIQKEFEKKTRGRVHCTPAEQLEIAQIAQRTTVADAQKAMKRKYYGKEVPWSTCKSIYDRYNPRTGKVREGKRGRPAELSKDDLEKVKQHID
eukprot:gene2197-4815_t